MPKLLIVATRFFPSPTTDVVRLKEWCRFLPRHGWTVTVLTRNTGQASERSIRETFGQGVRVYYFDSAIAPTPSEQAAKGRAGLLRRMGRRLAIWAAVPDARIYYWRSMRRELLRLVNDERPDVLLTSSPPHPIHAVGWFLARQTGIPWVADFRDPYLFDTRYRPKGLALLTAPWHRRFERRVYRAAALVIHAIPAHARWARARYPWARDRMVTLTNGSPPELLSGSVTGTSTRDGRRSIRSVGHASPEETLLIARAINARRDADTLELRLVGRRPESAPELVRILGDRLSLIDRTSHSIAMAEIAGADVLVATLSAQRAGVQGITSKLFEYAAVGRPVIVINPTAPDLEIFQKTPGIRFLERPTVGEVGQALEDAFAMPASVLEQQRQYARQHFSRDAQGEQLAALLTACCPSRIPSADR